MNELEEAHATGIIRRLIEEMPQSPNTQQLDQVLFSIYSLGLDTIPEGQMLKEISDKVGTNIDPAIFRKNASRVKKKVSDEKKKKPAEDAFDKIIKNGKVIRDKRSNVYFGFSRYSSGILEYRIHDGKDVTNHIGAAHLARENYFPPLEEVNNCVRRIAAIASISEPVETHIRVAYVKSQSASFIDLCNGKGDVIEIKNGRCNVIEQSNCPVIFLEGKSSSAIAAPDLTVDIRESLKDMRLFMNMESKKDFRLLVDMMCFMLRGEGHFPMLILAGDPGSSKTTVSNIIRKLIDPHTVPSTGFKDEREYSISAMNNYIIAFDNLTYISKDQSDMLCRAVTGGGFTTRALRTDSDTVEFDSVRPIIITTTNQGILKAIDAQSRAVTIRLKKFPDGKLLSDRRVQEIIEAKAPAWLGSLIKLTAFASHEMKKNMNNPSSGSTHRMANFAEFGTYVRKFFEDSSHDESFESDYVSSSRDVKNSIFHDHPTTEALRNLAKDHRGAIVNWKNGNSLNNCWSGNITQLKEKLFPNTKANTDEYKYFTNWFQEHKDEFGKINLTVDKFSKGGYNKYAIYQTEEQLKLTIEEDENYDDTSKTI